MPRPRGLLLGATEAGNSFYKGKPKELAKTDYGVRSGPVCFMLSSSCCVHFVPLEK